MTKERPVCTKHHKADRGGRFDNRWPEHPDAKVVRAIPGDGLEVQCPHCKYIWIRYAPEVAAPRRSPGKKKVYKPPPKRKVDYVWVEQAKTK